MIALLISLIMFMVSTELLGAEIKGVYFEDSITEGDEVLSLRGGGLLKWLCFFY
jgi:hypothetical protein